MILNAKMAMYDLQPYPWNLNLIKMWKITLFSWLEKWVFLWVSPLSLIIKKCVQVTSAEKPQTKIYSLKKQKHEYLIHTRSDKPLNRALSSLHCGSLQIKVSFKAFSSSHWKLRIEIENLEIEICAFLLQKHWNTFKLGYRINRR